MSTEPARISAPPAATAVAPKKPESNPTELKQPEPKRPEFNKPRFDPRYIAPVFISCILLVGHLSAGILVSPQKTGLAIVAAMIAELFLGRIYYGKWPHLASAYVTGISVGILLRAEAAYWPYVYCAAISIYSKYVLRVGNRHIWNPSNFGIALTVIMAQNVVHTLGQEFGNSLLPMLAIWVVGSVIISRLKRFHICATYVVSFLVLAWVRSFITHDAYWTEAAPITGPMYQLFTFFMITDPRTTVSTRKGQIVVAFLVAVAEALFRIYPYVPAAYSGGPAVHGWITDVISIHAPYFALFFVGPVANVWEILQKRGAGKTAPPSAAPATA